MMLSLVAASCSAAGQTASNADDILHTKNTITVQGTASITAAPTIAYVSIGVATFNKEADTATPISGGELKVEASVTMVYSY